MNFIYLVEADGVLSGPVNLPVVPGAGQQIPANGLVLEQLGEMPKSGRKLAIAGCEIEIIEVRANVVKTARVQALPSPAAVARSSR